MIQSVRSKEITLASSTNIAKIPAAKIYKQKVAKQKITKNTFETTAAGNKTVKKTTGLRYWMLRVLEECDRVSTDFSADPVHDLRVSLRRCRSMADGLIAIDPDPDWKAMKKAGKRLFQRLGNLRDLQVMMEWIEKLHPPAPTTTRVDAGDSPASPPSAQNSGYIANLAANESETEFQSEPAIEPRNPSPRDPAAQSLLEILARREAEQKREARAAL